MVRARRAWRKPVRRFVGVDVRKIFIVRDVLIGLILETVIITPHLADWQSQNGQRDRPYI